MGFGGDAELRVLKECPMWNAIETRCGVPSFGASKRGLPIFHERYFPILIDVVHVQLRAVDG